MAHWLFMPSLQLLEASFSDCRIGGGCSATACVSQLLV
jgi:hypothetical protein